jgi:hypothetical protein
MKRRTKAAFTLMPVAPYRGGCFQQPPFGKIQKVTRTLRFFGHWARISGFIASAFGNLF